MHEASRRAVSSVACNFGCVPALQDCVQHVAEFCLQQRDGYVTKLLVRFCKILHFIPIKLLGVPGAWIRVPWALGLGGPLSDKHVSISAGLLGVRNEKAKISAHNRGWRNTLPWLVGSSSGPPPSRNSTTIGGGSATAKGSRVQSTLIAECLRDQQADSAWALRCRPL